MVDHKQYQALTTGTALYCPDNYNLGDSGILSLSDQDRADFLQRMTTNNIAVLQPGQSTVTVLTSPTARILYVFTVLCRTEDLLLLPAVSQANALAQHLRSQIFFMDAVKVHDLSATYVRWRLMGPNASKALHKFDLDLDETAEGGWQEANGLLAVKQDAYDVPGYELLVSHEQQSEVMDRLVAANVMPIDPETYHTRRIELGRPAAHHEFTEEYNPLETGLGWACAENKGCYTGQEIIARQITYDKVTKSLVAMKSGTLLNVGDEVKVENRVVGKITSSVHSLALGTPLSLAILRRTHAQVGQAVEVGGESAAVIEL